MTLDERGNETIETWEWNYRRIGIRLYMYM